MGRIARAFVGHDEGENAPFDPAVFGRGQFDQFQLGIVFAGWYVIPLHCVLLRSQSQSYSSVGQQHLKKDFVMCTYATTQYTVSYTLVRTYVYVLVKISILAFNSRSII